MKAKKLFRWFGYMSLLLLWLVVMLAPCFAFALAARGELSWQHTEYDSDRIWLVQERDQKGIGYHAVRMTGGDPVCIRNSVRFFLWEGSAEGQSADYCECLAADGTSAATECP
ncbi:MAG: hypothetical protein FJ030_10565 [Chloroflexi bacterium]|nr:hypothetical protein [Chloroflexota bacterium]